MTRAKEIAKNQAIKDMVKELPREQYSYTDGGTVEIWDFNPNKLRGFKR